MANGQPHNSPEEAAAVLLRDRYRRGEIDEYGQPILMNWFSGDPAIRAAQMGHASVAEQEAWENPTAQMGYAPEPEPEPEPAPDGGMGGMGGSEQRVYNERFADRPASSGEGISGAWNYIPARKGGAGGMSSAEQVASDKERAAMTRGSGTAGVMGEGAAAEPRGVTERVTPETEFLRPTPFRTSTAPQPSLAAVVAKKSGAPLRRARGAFLNLPENLRPEVLAGGLAIYPENYEQMVADAELDPKTTKQVLAGHQKWKRTLWGAMVDHSRLQREEKHIGQRAERDMDRRAGEEADEQAKIQRWLEESQLEQKEDYEIERAAYQEAMDDVVAKQDRAIDSLARNDIDPERWWNKDGGYRRVLGTIAIGLGAAAQGLGGIYGAAGPNMAYKIIKDQIDNDIRSQMADRRTKTAAVGARRGLLNTIMGQVRDVSQAQAIARIALLDQVKAKIGAMASGAVGDKARRNAEKLQELIDNDREILAAELRVAAGKLAEQRARGVAASKKKAPAFQAGGVIDQHLRERYHADIGGILLNGKDADAGQFIKDWRMYNSAQRTLNDVRKIMDTPGYTTSLYGVEVANKVMGAMTMPYIKKYFGVVIPKGEIEMAQTSGLRSDVAKRVAGMLQREIIRGPDGKLHTPFDAWQMARKKELATQAAGYKIWKGVYGNTKMPIKTGKWKNSKGFAPTFIPSGQAVGADVYLGLTPMGTPEHYVGRE